MTNVRARVLPGLLLLLLVLAARAVVTGAGETASVSFLDGAVLTLGPGSRATIGPHRYDPATGRGALSVDVAAGTFGFRSGAMAKADHDIRTPFATLVLHGTRFGVDLVNEGIIVLEGAAEARFLGGEVLRLAAGQCTARATAAGDGGASGDARAAAVRDGGRVVRDGPLCRDLAEGGRRAAEAAALAAALVEGGDRAALPRRVRRVVERLTARERPERRPVGRPPPPKQPPSPPKPPPKLSPN
jgi:hypothetical protein